MNTRLKHAKQTRNELLLGFVGAVIMLVAAALTGHQEDAGYFVAIAIMVFPFLVSQQRAYKKIIKEVQSKRGHLELG